MAKSRYEVEITARDRTKAAFRSLDNSVKKTERAMTGMNTAMAGIAGGLVVTGLVRTAKASLDAADKIHKLSQRTGASAKFLSEMRLATELSGTSMETFSKALQKSQKAAADAATGLSTPKRAFELLGISVNDFLKLSPEKQFEALADGLAGVGNESLRTQIAMDIMGRSGTEMLSVMAGGAQGIRDMRAESEALGRSLNDDQVAAAAAANDAMTRLTAAMGSFAEALTIELAPSIANGIQLLQEFLGLAQKYDGFFTAQGKLGNQLQKTEARMKAIRVELQNLDMSTFSGQQRAKSLGEEYNRLSQRSNEYIRAIDEENNKQTAANREKEKAEQNSRNLATATDRLARMQDKSSKKTKTAKSEMEKYVDSLKAAQASIDAMADKEMAAFELWSDGVIGIQAYQDALGELGHELPEISTTTKKTTDESLQYWDNMVENMQRAFGDLIYDGLNAMFRDGEFSFKKFTDTILDMFIRMIADMIAAWATAKIAEMIGGVFGVGGGSAGGSIMGGLANAGLSSLLGGAASSGGGSIMGSIGSALGIGGGGAAVSGGGAVAGGGLLGPTIGGGGAVAGGGAALSSGGGAALLGPEIATGAAEAATAVEGIGTAASGASAGMATLAMYAGAAYVAYEVFMGLTTDSPLEIAAKQARDEFGMLNEAMAQTNQSAVALGEQAQYFGEVGGAAFVAVNEELMTMQGVNEGALDAFGAMQQAIEAAGAEMIVFGGEAGQTMIKLSGNVEGAKEIIKQMGNEGSAALQSIGNFTSFDTGQMNRLKEVASQVGAEINLSESSYDDFSGTVTGSLSAMIALQQEFGSSLMSSIGLANGLAGAMGSIPSAPNIGSSAGGGLQGFATGGSFMVSGSGGTDSQLVAFKATPGERVSVETPSQQNGGNGGGGEPAPIIIQLSGDAAGLERFIRVTSDDQRVRVARSGLRSTERVF